jgi:hypothetical protein
LLRVLASELRHVVPFDGMAIVLYDEATSEVHLQMVEIVHQPSVVLPSDLPPEETMSS